jgi:hypothetical protein
MNERIKAIGRQAGFAFIEDGVYGQRWYSSKCGMDKLKFEKFAELIVRECVGVVEGGRFLHDQAPTAIFAKECSGAIKRHFGVES